LNLCIFVSSTVYMQQLLHSKIIGKGNPLLILHGFLGSGDNWISLARRFMQSFEVHLIDLRNHGRSFHDDEMNYEVMRDDVVDYCNHYKLETINIIGHSMGGKVAMFLAVSYPKLIRKLIVADIAPHKYDTRAHDFILKALQTVDFKVQKTRSEIDTVLTTYVENKAIRQFLLKNIHRLFPDELAFRFNLPVLVTHYDEITDSLPVYSTYEGESLFLKGAESPYIQASDISLIKAHFPQAKIVTISRAGHWLHAENPDDFYKECIQFLS